MAQSRRKIRSIENSSVKSKNKKHTFVGKYLIKKDCSKAVLLILLYGFELTSEVIKPDILRRYSKVFSHLLYRFVH